MKHFVAVRDHALNALEYETISEREKLQVELAALLHDADDKKLFPNSSDHQNARKILQESFENEDDDFIEGIIEMIDLVSCSKNGDSEPPKPWMAIPRDCDRIEAIGKIGIERCQEVTISRKIPFHIDSTPRAYTDKEVLEAASLERFQKYMNGEPSLSMIDHYYDKLLHVGDHNHLRSQNKYILSEASRRTEVMIDFVSGYWITLAS